MSKIVEHLRLFFCEILRDQQEELIERLQEENAHLREKISFLECELNSIEQLSRSLYWKKYCSHQQ